MTRRELPLVLDTVVGPDTLELLQATLDELWAMDDVDDVVRMHMDLAVGEIGANIIEHAASDRPVHLTMTVDVQGDAVRTSFFDDGRPAPVALAGVTMPDELAERGRGLAIAHRVLDELSYRRDRDGNHWTLTRKLH